jgi:hypothetical protein
MNIARGLGFDCKECRVPQDITSKIAVNEIGRNMGIYVFAKSLNFISSNISPTK